MRRIVLISLVSGTLPFYWIYSYNGTIQIEQAIGNASELVNFIITLSRSVSCLSNAFFLYQIGMKFNPVIQNKKECLLLMTIPLGSLQFFTGGLLGARHWGLSEPVCVIIGLALFGMRAFALIDASKRLPIIVSDISKSVQRIYFEHDLRELFGTLTTFGITSVLTVLSIDSMYMPLRMLLTLISYGQDYLHETALLLSIPGVLINWPMAWYWCRRGIIQATNSGRIQPDSVNPDPTDRYTLLAFMMSSLLVIQVLSRISGAQGPVGEEFGDVAIFASLIVSLLFTLTATLPNNASTLRDFSSYLLNRLSPREESGQGNREDIEAASRGSDAESEIDEPPQVHLAKQASHSNLVSLSLFSAIDKEFPAPRRRYTI